MKKEKTVTLRFTDDELNKVENDMKKIGITNRSQYIRFCTLNQVIFDYDEEITREEVKLIKHISDNMNQIARRINSTGNIYEDDINELKEKYEELWQQQVFILSSLRKLKS